VRKIGLPFRSIGNLTTGRTLLPGTSSEAEMQENHDSGADFIEGFALIAGALWVGGAAFFLILASIGRGMLG